MDEFGGKYKELSADSLKEQLDNFLNAVRRREYYFCIWKGESSVFTMTNLCFADFGWVIGSYISTLRSDAVREIVEAFEDRLLRYRDPEDRKAMQLYNFGNAKKKIEALESQIRGLEAEAEKNRTTLESLKEALAIYRKKTEESGESSCRL